MSRRLIIFLLLTALPGSIFAIQFNPPLDEGIEFPETVVNETSTVNFTVSEPNDVRPVIVRISQPEQDEFSVEPNERELRGGGQVVFEVSFSPEEADEFDGRLIGVVISEDGDRMDFSTTLNGTGINEDDPVIEVRPLELSFELTEPGDSDEATADVGNAGEGDLEFEVIIDDDCEWLEVDPQGGEIAGNSDQIIQLNFSTTNAIPDSGRHSAEVIISSNDPENEEVIIDVTLTVSYHPVPVISVNTESIELNITELNQQVQEAITITNNGERTLEFIIAVPEVPWIDVTPIAGELEPDAEQEITVEGIHSGLPNGEYEAAIFINSNDPVNSEIPLNVSLVVNIDENVPRIGISDDTVRFEITEPEQQDIDTLIISNSGHQPLVFILNIRQDQSWFTAQPDTGLIEPDASIEIIISTTDQIPENGEYTSNLEINSNDPVNSETSIEVQLLVDINGVDGRYESNLIQEFHLSEPFPNPFNSTTTITYGLGKPAPTRIVVYDMSGRQVAILHEGYLPAGYHRSVFNAEGLTSGVYLIKAVADGQVLTQEIVLTR